MSRSSRATIAQALDRTVPHSVRVSIDFVPGESNDVVKVYVDDQLRITGSSWENYYRHDIEAAGSNNTVPVIDQLMLRVSGTARPANQGIWVSQRPSAISSWQSSALAHSGVCRSARWKGRRVCGPSIS